MPKRTASEAAATDAGDDEVRIGSRLFSLDTETLDVSAKRLTSLPESISSLQQLTALHAQLMQAEEANAQPKTLGEKLGQFAKVKRLPGKKSWMPVTIGGASAPLPPTHTHAPLPLPAPLPPGWQMLWDEQGRAYYVNPQTGETSWTPPASD